MAIEFLNLPPSRGLVPTQAALLIHYHITSISDSDWAWPALLSAHILRRAWAGNPENLLTTWINPIEWSTYHATSQPLKWGLRLLQQVTHECQDILTRSTSNDDFPPALRMDSIWRLRSACHQCANITHEKCPHCAAPICRLCLRYNITIDRHHTCDTLRHRNAPDLTQLYHV